MATEHESRDGPSRARPPANWNLIVAGVLAAFGLHMAFAQVQTNFDDAALGQASVAIFAEHDGDKVHGSRFADVEAVLAAAVRRALPTQVLWLGNSQIHGVNQPKPGDQTAPGRCFEQLLPAGIDLTTLSFPNANLQEHYVAFLYARERLKNLRVLVLPVVFDDLRETGLRADLHPMVADAAVRRALEQTVIGQRLVSEVAADGVDANDGELAGLRDTLQERTEASLDRWLDVRSPMWRLRGGARGSLFLGLFRFRNTVLGITPQSKRALRRSAYEPNLAALHAMLDAAEAASVRVVLYVAPLRPDVEPPYVLSEYETFQHDMAQLALARGLTFANFGDLIPVAHWGMTDSTNAAGDNELDFMHFQASGHTVLARAVADKIRQALASP